MAWRTADGGKRTTPIGWLPVYVSGDLNEQTGDRPQTYLVVDWPAGHGHPYHLYRASLKAPPTAKRCVQWSRGRFAIEQFFQRDNTDLGFDHYEGRSWRGFHHHLVLSCVAYLFALPIFLRSKKNSCVTWEPALRAIQPWLTRSTGCCPFCKANFDPKFCDST